MLLPPSFISILYKDRQADRQETVGSPRKREIGGATRNRTVDSARNTDIKTTIYAYL